MATILRRNDKYSARVRVKGFPVISQTFNTQRSAQVWAIETEDAIRRGIYSFKTAIVPKLGEALSRYETTVSAAKRGHQPERYVIRLWGRTKLAATPLDHIRASDIAALRDQWLATLAPATVVRRLTLLSHLFETARRDWSIPVQNPTKDVRKPIVRNEKARRIGADEFQQILNASRSPALKVIARLALATGARLGELVTAQWKYVDCEARTLHLPLTKNGSSRTIPLAPDALTVLNALPRRLDGGPIFNTVSHSMSTAWIRAVDKARREYENECMRTGQRVKDDWLVGVRFHDLRHEAISRMAEQGLDTFELAAISGHRSMQMLSRYTHLKAENLAQKLARAQQPTT